MEEDMQWTILFCPSCGYTTIEAHLICPRDGAFMKAIPEHPDFGVSWKLLQERIGSMLSHVDAYGLLKLEADHDCTTEQLKTWLTMQRDYQHGFYLPLDRSKL